MGFTDQLLKQFMSEGGLSALTKTTGAESNQLESLLGMALPALISGMQRNASTSGGAAALAKALDDHAGDSDDVTALLQNADISDGQKILKHILGGSSEQLQAGLASKTGLSMDQVMGALSASAPALMSLLGTQKKQGNFDVNGIAGMFTSLVGDGNGGFGLDDIISMAMQDKDADGKNDVMQALGGLFSKK